jgi:histone demethylase JARID1
LFWHKLNIFLGVVLRIRKDAERFGICKIVPPQGWNCPVLTDSSNPKLFDTKRQRVNTLQEGQGFDDGDRYSAASYKEMADKFYNEWISNNYASDDSVTSDKLEKDYWDLVETNHREAVVDYGNDIDTIKYGSGFLNGSSEDMMHKYMGNVDFNDLEYYRHSTWNLNNVPSAPGSVLKYVKSPITGINVPWLYYGMLFASFCWHNEDNYFYSINYNHYGAAKQWYGTPGSSAEAFEKVSKEFLLGLFIESPDILHHMTTQISPRLLAANRVPVYKSMQEAGTFIITFPKAFHGGFSYGFNCGEAVNFAIADWISAGAEAETRYRLFARESVFSYQRLLFTLLQHANEMRSGLKRLLFETNNIIEDELNFRSFVLGKGVKDLSRVAQLPPNDFSIIDDKAIEYDDLRLCCICKQVCVLSAIGCECDSKRVGCLGHFGHMCKCPNDRKFLLEWAPRTLLRSLRYAQSESRRPSGAAQESDK